MVIVLDFSDVNYANALSYRLSELSSNLDIKINMKSQYYDVYLTDHDYLNKDEKYIYLSKDINDELSIYTPASQIFSKIIDITGLNYNVSLKKRKTKVYSFYSKEGGAGVSSISITFSRGLLLEGKSVIYVSNTNLYYSGHRWEKSRRLKMKYELDVKGKIDIFDYIEKDIYSLNILNISDYDNLSMIINLLVKLNMFDAIVLDYSNFQGDIIGDYLFYIDNADDMRNMINNKKDKEYLILNRAMNSKENTYDYLIPYDKHSFIFSDKYIEVRLDGNFGRNITTMIKSIENDK